VATGPSDGPAGVKMYSQRFMNFALPGPICASYLRPGSASSKTEAPGTRKAPGYNRALQREADGRMLPARTGFSSCGITSSHFNTILTVWLYYHW